MAGLAEAPRDQLRSHCSLAGAVAPFAYRRSARIQENSPKNQLFFTNMQTRPLGKTGLQLPILSFGASSLGAEFRSMKLDEALDGVRVGLNGEINLP